jgi:hypothetical protein
MTRLMAACSTVFIALLLAGCGGGAADDRPALAPVTGKLMLDGQPVPNADVQFSPEKGASSNGRAGADGTFTLTYGDGTPGAAVGKHAVTVTAGGPTPEQQKALDAWAEGDRTVTVPKNVPPLVTYTSTATVAEGENNLTVDLQKGAGAGGPARNSAER